jgi:hypothetical protein
MWGSGRSIGTDRVWMQGDRSKDASERAKGVKAVGEGGPGSERDGDEAAPGARPAVGRMVRRTTRFSREYVATMISLATAAFGVVAALAWNTAITEAVQKWIGTDSGRISALFIYALVITAIGVTVIVLLGRLATRINAEPVEFKYPIPPRA